jgi:hypothetical protein
MIIFGSFFRARWLGLDHQLYSDLGADIVMEINIAQNP